MNSSYEATWLPIGHETAGQDPTALAVEHVERQCARARQRGVLVTDTRRDAATPSLARFARQQSHVTRLSRSGASPGIGPVLVDMPDVGLLEYAHYLARGRSLCAVESGAFRLHGWAAATSAVDLVTGTGVAPVAKKVLDLFDDLMFVGNNGWAEEPAKRDARRLLGQLAGAVPRLDADFVAGYVIGRGASGEAAKRLQAMFTKIVG